MENDVEVIEPECQVIADNISLVNNHGPSVRRRFVGPYMPATKVNNTVAVETYEEPQVIQPAVPNEASIQTIRDAVALDPIATYLRSSSSPVGIPTKRKVESDDAQEEPETVDFAIESSSPQKRKSRRTGRMSTSFKMNGACSSMSIVDNDDDHQVSVESELWIENNQANCCENQLAPISNEENIGEISIAFPSSSNVAHSIIELDNDKLNDTSSEVVAKITAPGVSVDIDANSDEIKTNDTEVKTGETEVKTDETEVKTGETEVKTIDTEVKTIETEVKTNETEVKAEDIVVIVRPVNKFEVIETNKQIEKSNDVNTASNTNDLIEETSISTELKTPTKSSIPSCLQNVSTRKSPRRRVTFAPDTNTKEDIPSMYNVNRQLLDMFKIKPVKVLLIDIQSATKKYSLRNINPINNKKVSTKPNKKEYPLRKNQDEISIAALPQKTKIVDINTEASSQKNQDSFEEIVAKKLAAQGKVVDYFKSVQDTPAKNSKDVSKQTINSSENNKESAIKPVANPIKKTEPKNKNTKQNIVSIIKNIKENNLVPSSIQILSALSSDSSAPKILPPHYINVEEDDVIYVDHTKQQQKENDKNSSNQTDLINSKHLHIVPTNNFINETESSQAKRKLITSPPMLLHPSLRYKFKKLNCGCSSGYCDHEVSVEKITPVTEKTTHKVLSQQTKSTTKISSSENDVIGDVTKPIEIEDPLEAIQPVATEPKSNTAIKVVSSPSRTRSHLRNTSMFKLSGPSSPKSLVECEVTSPMSKPSRPSLLKSPVKNCRSLLSRSLSTSSNINQSKLEKHFSNYVNNMVEISDSDTMCSHCTSDDNEVIEPVIVHIPSDTDDEIKKCIVKTEIILKKEIKSEPEEDKLFSPIKSSVELPSVPSQNDITTKSSILPTFIACAKETNELIEKTGQLKSVSIKQIRKLSERFHLKKLNLTVVKLNKRTINRVIQLCNVKGDWHNRDMLNKTGMSSYDIVRIGVKTTRNNASKGRYGFRKMVYKKRDVFQSMIEKPKTKSTTKNNRELEFLKSQQRKMKEIAKAKQKEETKKKTMESIRRSLLKINAKFLNQNKFWCYLDQGSSVSKAITL